MALLFLQSALVMAQVCPKPTSLDDVLGCLKENHYLVQIKNLEVSNTENLSEGMSQRPNPTLDIQSVHARGGSRQTQVILAQELDIGGRLSALKEQGKLIHEVSKTEKNVSKEDVVENVLLNIHHLIHLNETQSVNREVLGSLESVTRALKNRPVLNPEQEASLLNFNLQKAEVNNLLALLQDEEEEVLLFFFLNGGYKKEDILKIMEDHHHPLELKNSSDSMSLNLAKLGLDTKLAKEEFELQKAIAWNGISVGAMYMDDKLENISEKLYGVALNIPIPIWQRNGANKMLAQRAYENSTRQFNLFKHKESIEKDSLVGRIEKLKTGLEKMPEKKELNSSHRRVEKLYSQGLINANTYLSSHQVWRDVSSSRLELEEKILRLTIQYYRLTGKLNEVHL